MKTINNILIYGAVAMVSLLGSCTKEPSTDVELSGGKISINLPCKDDTQTRANNQTEAETQIDLVTILFYSQVDEGDWRMVKRLNPGDVVIDNVAGSSSLSFPSSLIDTKQTYRIAVIANAYGIDVDEGDDIRSLRNVMTNIKEPILPPSRGAGLLMSGTVTHNFSEMPETYLSDFVRQAVKLNVKVTMNQTFTDNYPDAKFGTGVDGIGAPELSILNVPTDSYVMPVIQELQRKFYIDYADLKMTATDTEWMATAYVYENITMGTGDQVKAESTYFILQLPYQLDAGSEVVTDNYYKFYINDPYDTENPHRTVRNTLYNVSVAVNGFGGAVPDINGTQVKTTVLPWEGEISQIDPVGEYLKVPSAIEIEYGEDFKLNIQASHAVTVTNTNQKIAMTQSDKVITLRSDDMDTKVKTPNYDKITVKMGSLTKEIKVSYRPHPGYLMAKRNLTADAQTIKEAPNEYSYGAHFKYGSVIATKSFDHIAADDLYDVMDVGSSPMSKGHSVRCIQQ